MKIEKYSGNAYLYYMSLLRSDFEKTVVKIESMHRAGTLPNDVYIVLKDYIKFKSDTYVYKTKCKVYQCKSFDEVLAIKSGIESSWLDKDSIADVIKACTEQMDRIKTLNNLKSYK